jgi:hypothetical protein
MVFQQQKVKEAKQLLDEVVSSMKDGEGMGKSGKKVAEPRWGKRCGFGVSVMKERGRIADSGVSATEKSQKCGTVLIQQWRQVKSVERWCFSIRRKSIVLISGVSAS